MNSKYCLIPKNIIKEKLSINYAYYEVGETEKDTGWRFFNGEETDEFLSNPDNIILLELKEVLEYDPTAIPVKIEIDDLEFERKDGKWEFVNRDESREEYRFYYSDINKNDRISHDKDKDYYEIYILWLNKKSKFLC